ncbi:MAG: DUF4340 domain-containing protein [Deltaproteobacteria bacterium]|nr:DUF4340 domain-containing protein [Deltaproteobacteria bacterium]
MKDFTKSILKTFASICVLGGLGAYAYLVEFKKAEEDEKKKDESKKLFALKKEDAQSLEVAAKGTVISLAKADGKWRITAPVQTEADQNAADGVAGAFDTLKTERVTEENPANLAQYGLHAPELRVSVKTSGGAELGLKVGMKNEFDNTYYVMRDGDPRVYQAPSSVKHSFDKDLFALRDKRLFFFEKNDEVQKLEVRLEDKAYSAEREGDRWRLRLPADDRADDEEVTKVLNALRSLRATAVAAEKEGEGADFGLKVAKVSFSVWKGPENALQQVVVAKRDAGGKQKVYARRSGAETVWEIGEQILKDADKKEFDLRFKKVMDFKKDEVRKVVFKSAAEEWTLVKGTTDTGEQWEIEAPERAKARPYKMNSVLYNLTNMKAIEFRGGGDAARKELGLASPSRRVEVIDGAGKSLGWIEIGDATTSGPAIMSNVRPQAAIVEKARVDEIPWKYADYKEEPKPPDAGTAPKGK